VAVVLSGAAARGAFQAGALAEIVPALERQGLTPTVWLGTSAGGMNCALWCAAAHRGAVAAAEEVVGVWSRMGDRRVFRSLLPVGLARVGTEYVRGALLGQGRGTTALLDTAPLRRTAEELLDVDQLADNLSAGVVAAVGVVATRVPARHDQVTTGASSGRSVLFLHEHAPSDYAGDPDRALDVLRTTISAEHVMASAAIPVAFPAVRVTHPPAGAGWYLDGGVRLNTPLRTAIELGADRIVLVSATATRYGGPLPPAAGGTQPDLADAAAQVVHAVLADRTTEDLRQVLRTNRLIGQVVGQATGEGGGRTLVTRTGRPYRPVEVLVVSPPPGELGRLAARVYERRTAGLRALADPDSFLIGRAIRGAGDDVGRRELLSYLFFDQEYFAASLELGRAAALAALSHGWQR
jgi:NTE family protein